MYFTSSYFTPGTNFLNKKILIIDNNFLYVQFNEKSLMLWDDKKYCNMKKAWKVVKEINQHLSQITNNKNISDMCLVSSSITNIGYRNITNQIKYKEFTTKSKILGENIVLDATTSEYLFSQFVSNKLPKIVEYYNKNGLTFIDKNYYFIQDFFKNMKISIASRGCLERTEFVHEGISVFSYTDKANSTNILILEKYLEKQDKKEKTFTEMISIKKALKINNTKMLRYMGHKVFKIQELSHSGCETLYVNVLYFVESKGNKFLRSVELSINDNSVFKVYYKLNKKTVPLKNVIADNNSAIKPTHCKCRYGSTLYELTEIQNMHNIYVAIINGQPIIANEKEHVLYTETDVKEYLELK